MLLHITSAHFKRLAQAGLVAKGLVYCLMGLLAFMAAFHLGGQSAGSADKEGVMSFIQGKLGGRLLLAAIGAGLVCYSAWRLVQAFADTENKGDNASGYAVRLRYVFSGLAYASLIVYIAKILLHQQQGGGQGMKQSAVQQLLSEPFGAWVIGGVAVLMAGVGVYQVYYGLSEKYRKHVEEQQIDNHRRLLLLSGKIGYVARGVVWLLIGWLFAKAAMESNASRAGDTAGAFRFLANASYGTYLVAAMGLGLVCYGAFNFIRARYDTFSW